MTLTNEPRELNDTPEGNAEWRIACMACSEIHLG